jgi:hypothetical protein
MRLAEARIHSASSADLGLVASAAQLLLSGFSSAAAGARNADTHLAAPTAHMPVMLLQPLSVESTAGCMLQWLHHHEPLKPVVCGSHYLAVAVNPTKQAGCCRLCMCCSKWLMPKERLLQCQQEDRAKGLSENHIQQLKVYFTQCELAAGSSQRCSGQASAGSVYPVTAG